MEIELVITLLIMAAIIVPLVAAYMVQKLRHRFMVPEGFAGLLYHHGKFVAQLATGRHIRWGRGFTASVQDVRRALLAVTGQEILTSDNVSLKANLSVSYEIADPMKAFSSRMPVGLPSASLMITPPGGFGLYVKRAS